MGSTPRLIEAEARLNTRNDLTLPEPIAEVLGAKPNDVLVFEVDPTRPDVAIVHRVPGTFAGALTGVYGTSDDVTALTREEHASWGD